MKAPWTHLLEALGERMDEHVPPEVAERIARLTIETNAYGFDRWGMDIRLLRRLAVLAVFLYRKYFRVHAEGLENIPAGRVLIVGNHSGQIPMDGAMIWTALLLGAEPPRVVRAMVEKLAPTLPFMSTIFARTGQVTGTPENCTRLLEENHAVMVFPEGVRGIGKSFGNRYTLQRFGSGFMRLALRTRSPIVPVGYIGAEESVISLSQLKPLARLLGLPYIPLIPTILPIPLPTHHAIYFGKPLRFDGDPDEDERSIRRKVRKVEERVEKLIERGLGKRRTIF